MKDSPAEKPVSNQKMLLLKWMENVVGKPLDQVVKLVRGKEGTTVNNNKNVVLKKKKLK